MPTAASSAGAGRACRSSDACAVRRPGGAYDPMRPLDDPLADCKPAFLLRIALDLCTLRCSSPAPLRGFALGAEGPQ